MGPLRWEPLGPSLSLLNLLEREILVRQVPFGFDGSA